MSIVKFLSSIGGRNTLPRYTDATRRGGEYCPYCGSYHFSQSEMDACASAHSSSSEGLYRCDRCGQYHTSMTAANHCCEREKRYERKYDPEEYKGYTYGNSYSSEQQEAEKEASETNGIFDTLFNLGGSSNEPSNDSSGGFFDSFFNAGGGNNDNTNSGGGFWPWQ